MEVTETKEAIKLEKEITEKKGTPFPLVIFEPGIDVLNVVSEEVTPEDILSEDTKNLVELLKKYVYFYNAAGISAIQIGIPKRIFVGRDEKTLEIFINPVILNQSAETTVEYEGCLSFPDIFVPVERSKSVTVRYQNLSGETVENTFDGLLARVVLHELEHLDGKIFLDNASPLKRKLVLEKIAKLKKSGRWNRKLTLGMSA